MVSLMTIWFMWMLPSAWRWRVNSRFSICALALYKNGAFHAMVNAPLSATALNRALQNALDAPPDDAP